VGLAQVLNYNTFCHHLERPPMAQREGLASVNLDYTCAIGQRVVDLLVSLGEEGMASGIDEGFDIEAFVEAVTLAA